MYPWISRTLDFCLQFCETKCGLYMDVYGILAGTETWINYDINNSQIPELLNKVPRVSAKGGGVGFFLRKAFNSSILNDFNPKSFELVDMLMRLYLSCHLNL